MNQEGSTTKQSSAEDTSIDVMAARPLHRIMVLLNRPAEWSNFRSGLSMLLLAGLSAAVWWMLFAEINLALLVGALLLLFFLGDLLILFALPRLRISYGSWQPQFFQLAFLRTLAVIGIGFIALFAGWLLGALIVVTLQALGTAAMIWGAIVEPAGLQTRELEIRTDRLNRGTRPIRLFHISDLHIERLSRREDDILRSIEIEQPDFIVITGDYVNLSYNRDPETYRQTHDFLAQLSAPFGVYATLGTPTVDIRDNVVPMFDDLSINLLRGECRPVPLGDGQRIVLLGVDCTHHIGPDAAILERLARQAPADAVQLLLYHSPELMPQAAAEGIDLYLCGHTHGGQVRLPLIGPLLTSSHLGRQYVMGLYRLGCTHLYVSRGVGLEGLSAPRVRLLARPEVTMVTIRPE
jgi:predicted MPP superfamily phosphohydrolase